MYNINQTHKKKGTVGSVYLYTTYSGKPFLTGMLNPAHDVLSKVKVIMHRKVYTSI